MNNLQHLYNDLDEVRKRNSELLKPQANPQMLYDIIEDLLQLLEDTIGELEDASGGCSCAS